MDTYIYLINPYLKIFNQIIFVQVACTMYIKHSTVSTVHTVLYNIEMHIDDKIKIKLKSTNPEPS